MPRIPIESKHTYKSYNSSICGVTVDAVNYNAVDNENRPILIYNTPLWPVTGTDDNNRIGRKIRTDAIVSEYFISLYNTVDNENINTLYDYYTLHNSDLYQSINSQVTPQSVAFNTNEQNLDVSIRHYIVEFDPTAYIGDTIVEIRQQLFDWFKQTYIQTGTFNMHSNRQQVLRESTAYTGQFKILYDKVIHLDLKHPIYHGNVSIPYIRHINFDGQGSEPTNKLLFSIFIGPTNVAVDYGSNSLGQFIFDTEPTAGPNIFVALIDDTIKLKFTDI